MTNDLDSRFLDFAVGASSAAETLLFAARAELSPEAALEAAMLDDLGGAFLEAIGPSELVGGPAFERPYAPAPLDPAYARARAIVSQAARAPEGLRWSWRTPFMRGISLPVEGASLLRLGAGQAIPEHDHTGPELTLVLRGELTDDQGRYLLGEVAAADVGVRHRPMVSGESDCVCLIVSTAPQVFRNPIARLFARLAN